jgi:hypothetical protein
MMYASLGSAVDGTVQHFGEMQDSHARRLGSEIFVSCDEDIPYQKVLS